MFILHLKLRAKSQSYTYFGTVDIRYMCQLELFNLGVYSMQVWAATDSGNLEVTYTHTEEHVRLFTYFTLCSWLCISQISEVYVLIAPYNSSVRATISRMLIISVGTVRPCNPCSLNQAVHSIFAIIFELMFKGKITAYITLSYCFRKSLSISISIYSGLCLSDLIT